jgi:ribosomal protein S18 acetylase RimI-like enzyme
MRIRAAEEGDAAAVTALWTEGYSGRGEGEGRRAPYEEREFFAAAAGGQLLVAELDGGVAGVVRVRPPGASEPAVVAAAGEAELSRLAVAAAARRQGIGRALAERCGEQARLTGASGVALWSRPYQQPAHRLYESLGYRRVPARDGSDEDGRRLVFLLDLGAVRGR